MGLTYRDIPLRASKTLAISLVASPSNAQNQGKKLKEKKGRKEREDALEARKECRWQSVAEWAHFVTEIFEFSFRAACILFVPRSCRASYAAILFVVFQEITGSN